MTALGLSLLVLLALVMSLSLVGVFIKSARNALPPATFTVIKPLSDPEQILYWRLKEAMPECVVLGQVSFSRFLRPQAAGFAGRQALLNVISRKTTDFLVCLPDFTVVAAVELDDTSHVKEKDARRDQIFQSAGIPLIRVHVRDIPSIGELRGLFVQ